MATALLVLATTFASPAYILVDEGSTLDKHVSSSLLSRNGQIVRRFEGFERASQRSGSDDLPVTLAIHANVDSLTLRMADKYCSGLLESVHNHVEIIPEHSILNPTTHDTPVYNSATAPMFGCPGAVALMMKSQNRPAIARAATLLGLTYAAP